MRSFVDVDTGKVLGRHVGKEVYTIGQKARIGSQSDKYYVVARGESSQDTAVYVGKGANHPALFSDYLLADLALFTWTSGAVNNE